MRIIGHAGNRPYCYGGIAQDSLGVERPALLVLLGIFLPVRFSNIFFQKGMIHAKFTSLMILVIAFPVARRKEIHRYLCT